MEQLGGWRNLPVEDDLGLFCGFCRHGVKTRPMGDRGEPGSCEGCKLRCESASEAWLVKGLCSAIDEKWPGEEHERG